MGEWMYRPTFSWPRNLLEVIGQFHAPAALPPGKKTSGTHSIGGWVGLRAGLDDMEKWKFLPLPGLGTPTPRSSIRYTVCDIPGS
jgi:hypothetical protein